MMIRTGDFIGWFLRHFTKGLYMELASTSPVSLATSITAYEHPSLEKNLAQLCQDRLANRRIQTAQAAQTPGFGQTP